MRLPALILLTVRASTVAASTLAAPPPDMPGPVRFVNDIYRRYERAGRPPDGRQVFAPELPALIQRDDAIARRQGEPNEIDYVLLCSCQDDADLKERTILVSQHARSAVVRAELGFSGPVTVLTLTLARDKRGWRIADIATPETPTLLGKLRSALGTLGAPEGRGENRLRLARIPPRPQKSLARGTA